jgi:hypothetical protein
MIYLTGGIAGSGRDAPPRHPRLGRMLTLSRANWPGTDQWWAADTGCYADPTAYDDDHLLAWPERRLPWRDRCLFATAPDRVGDPVATLALALPVLPWIRALGLPAALVAQDGSERMPIPWDKFDTFFVRGTTRWKLSEAAYVFAVEAAARGKWTHMGRVNSSARLAAAAVVGCQSADGTTIAFNPGRYEPEILRWLDRLDLQATFPLSVANLDRRFAWRHHPRRSINPIVAFARS